MVSRGMAVLVACYLGVVVWRMLGSLAARVRLARALRYKSTPDRRVATTFREVAEQTEGLGRELRGAEVWVLPGLTSPATLGWLRPRVIVPPSCELQDEAELQAVFWHELKHVERRDALWNGMVRACRTLLWFHPAVHHATAALHAQRELACDAAVVDEHPQSRDVYATCLVRFARAADLSPGPAIPTIDMASSAALLTRRVRSILSDGQATSRGARLARAAANVLLVGLMAATVPGLNILFAMEQAKVEVGLPRMGAAPAMAKVHVRKANAQGVAAVQPVVGSAGQGLALQHDEELAAQHRAAMGILTESTGMDDTATGDSRMAGGLNGAPGRGANPANAAAWGTIAMDAAERMGPLMNGHDSDDHH